MYKIIKGIILLPLWILTLIFMPIIITVWAFMMFMCSETFYEFKEEMKLFFKATLNPKNLFI